METDVITKGSTTANASLAPRLRAFKEQYCDENILIAEALREQFQERLDMPVLDVGAGLGDLARTCFSESSAILLDTEHWEGPIAPRHRRVVGDFFDYVDADHEPIGTLLFCHVLQYLDDDIARLRRAVAKLDARSVVTVLNDNTGPFGDLMAWAGVSLPTANPEVPIIPVSLQRYRVANERKIQATMSCPSFELMAEHFLTVLLDAEDNGVARRLVEERLRTTLAGPSIKIDETITTYERHD